MSERIESELLDGVLASHIDEESRRSLRFSADEILDAIDRIGPDDARTGLALGYVQSGKTTAMTALMARAVDRGYSIVIAFLGSTNILLDQNSNRISKYLGIENRSDYSWVGIRNPKGKTKSAEIQEWLSKGRALFIPVLKHSGRIDDLTKVLASIDGIENHRVLILDDEADQASLNTGIRSGTESKVYGSIDGLRSALDTHAFVQFTATPYGPLLLDPTDTLFPKFVQFLQPGQGYTGGREFFVDRADSVVRYIPSGDEQNAKKLPLELPQSLNTALWAFFVGSAILLEVISDSPPISMLIHSSHRNDVQDRYHFLINRKLRELREIAASISSIDELPNSAKDEISRLKALGVPELDHSVIIERLKYVLGETKLWLLNSISAVAQVDWNVSPIHILVGGNKLDRGFTVEGLTVTYMNRPASEQVDTIEQRARAFGYRSEFLPFCQFFGTARTVKMLREIVFTEYDLRAKMQEYVEEGRSIEDWSREIGLLLPGGSKPTRDSVVKVLSKSQFGWHQLRRPSLQIDDIEANWKICSDLGLFEAPLVDYGRLSFRTLTIDSSVAATNLLKQWRLASYSPDWRSEELIKEYERASTIQARVEIILMEQDAESTSPFPRVRSWREQEGFTNLFQGRDLERSNAGAFYPGDRAICGIDEEPNKLLIQVHRVQRRDMKDSDHLLALALHLGDRQIIRKGSHE